jgi:hypothetical protein
MPQNPVAQTNHMEPEPNSEAQRVPFIMHFAEKLTLDLKEQSSIYAGDHKTYVGVTKIGNVNKEDYDNDR